MIKGKYIFKQNGEIIAEKENILTSNGINMINRYLTDSAVDWAGSIAVGALYTVSASTDTSLAYEVGRSNVQLKTYRTTSGSNQIILKASLDPQLIASIYEIGVYPQNLDPSSLADNYYISDFSEIFGSSSVSSWKIGSSVATATNTLTRNTSRSGTYNILVPTGSVAYRSGFNLDISDFDQNDYLQVLYFVSATSTAPSLSVSLKDSASLAWNSSTAALTTSATGYYTASLSLTSLPDAGFSGLLDSVTLSLSGGTGSVTFDSIKIMSGNPKNVEEILVSRSSSTSPLIIKQYGQAVDIEYYLTVT